MKNIISVSIFRIILLLVLISYGNSLAWIYPEHREITLMAIQNLNIEYRLALDKLWAEAIIGYEDRLSSIIVDSTHTTNHTRIDYSAWPAIAGDHSTSSRDMLENILRTKWILEVANISAKLKVDLANSKNTHSHINSLRDADIRLQRVDPQYATRAGSNNVHFLLARSTADMKVKEYLIACLKKGAELNALGAYTWFHISALEKASKLSNESLDNDERSKLIIAALADEAFALHFLEDSFASGHTAGTWGNASQRKGTHDYYNEKGLEVVTWNGKRMILTGDAFMRKQDAEIAAESVRESIEQVIDSFTGKNSFYYHYNNELTISLPDSFDVGKNNFMPKRDIDTTLIDECVNVLITTPIPGLATGLGELPRFRSELGTFIGVVAAVRGNTINGGFGVDQNQPGVSGGIDAGLRLGLGLEGVMHGGGDGLVFLEVGWRQDASSSMKYGSSPNLEQGGQITSAIPGREAIVFRFRMPFWIIPLDLLVAAPILMIISPDTYAKMAVTAGLGGVIPWQAGMETFIGRFQFILGREIGVTLYGRSNFNDAILIPIKNNKSTALLNYRSTQFDFPVLEYRPFRTFSLDQSSSLVIQLNFGVDIPHNTTLVDPEGIPTPRLGPVWYVGIRSAFDWRFYW